MSQEKDFNEFLDKLQASIEKKEFVKLTLGKRVISDQDLKNIYVRYIELKGRPHLSYTYRYKTKDVVSNYSIEEGINLLKAVLGKNFLNADLFTIKADYQLRFNNKLISKLLISKPTHKTLAKTTHDKPKQRFIGTKNNVYLRSLGIVDQRGEVTKTMHDKYRQINKYVEIIDSIVTSENLPDTIKIIDMGAGKGYLTFALYDYLTNIKGLKTFIKGVDQNENLVKICNNIAQKSNFHNLEFLQGEIKDFEEDDLDILIALHACNTATDDAIYQGIKSSAGIIIVAPCCHKQIRQNMSCDNELAPILKHGILEERQAEILTDGLRALLLEMSGYKTKVFEFVSSEHTNKNLMITAIKTSKTIDKQNIQNQIDLIKKQFGIKYHHLEKLLENKN